MRIAEDIGASLKGGEVIELVSDLGGGKTTFTQGLAMGLGVKEKIHSPSFTISNEHQGSKLRLMHFDFYRLAEPGIMKQELSEVMGQKDSVVVIEWADIVEDLLPNSKITINIKVVSENERQLDISCSDETSNIIPHQYLTS